MPIYALLAASLAGLSGTDAAALPPLQDPGSPAARVLLIADQESAKPEAAAPAGNSEEPAPFTELNEALAAARARLEELSKAGAMAAAATQVRQEVQSLKEENQQLAAEVAALRASHNELQTARQGGEARIAELTEAVEQAAAEAKRIEQELVAMRWQNAQLNTNLARVQAVREKIEREARETQEELSAKVEILSKSAEQSAAEITRLRARLEDSQRDLSVASNSRAAAEKRLVELEDALQSAEDKMARSDEQLATWRSQLTQAETERDEATARMAELQSQGNQLRAALASAENDVDQLTRSKRELEEEVTMLRGAASSAADAARQNLLAVEERIKELDAALVAIQGAESETKLEGPEAIAPGAGPAGTAIKAPVVEAIERPAAAAEPTAGPDQAGPAKVATADEPEAAVQPTPESAPDQADKLEMAATTPTEAAVDGDLDLVKSVSAAEQQLDPQLVQLTMNLPLEKRLQVQGLLVDLKAKPDQRGLLMTVPGASLFEINSEKIEPTAHETLAKVADLLDAYKDRKVMIIGHTDSIGEQAYNKVLSQRRANLIKQFFVDYFNVDSTRLLTQGQGESQPIATNTTLAGRQANRRVDVLILN